jgi:hypothetical protein
MTKRRQRVAARRNIRRASRVAKAKKTLKKLPQSIRRALGKQAAKSRRRRAR